MLDKTLLGFVERQEKIYGRDEFAEGLGSRFVSVLKAAHEKTGLRAVITSVLICLISIILSAS